MAGVGWPAVEGAMRACVHAARARRAHTLTYMQATQSPPPTSIVPPRGVVRSAPAAWSAVFGWFSILVVLNLTTNPLVAVAAWFGCALLALVVGHARLIPLSLVVGIGMMLVIPGLSVAQGGGVRLTIGEISSSMPDLTANGIGWAVASTFRVPAQVLASVLMLAVPSRRMVDAVSRRSHRTALLAGLVVRLRPLLGRDARRIHDELFALGRVTGGSVKTADRMRTSAIVWQSMMMTMFDRAQSTARVLEARGVGPTSTYTSDSLTHPLLRDQATISPAINMSIAGCSLIAISVTVWARSIGLVSPPSITVFSGIDESVSPIAAIVAAACMAIGMIPAALIFPRRSRAAGYDSLTGTRSSSGSVLDRSLDDVPSGVCIELPSLQITDRRFDGRPLLATPAMSINHGEFVLLAGAGGSGKSTFIAQVLDCARQTDGDGVAQTVSLRSIGALFQDPDQQVVLDVVVEDVTQALRADGRTMHDIESAVLWAMRTLGVLHLAQRRCASLSGGELQRVAVAGVLARRPRLLVLDEPTAMLDEAGRSSLWEMIDQVRYETGCAVLVAEHNVDPVLRRADRVIVLSAGRVAWQGSADQADPYLSEHRCILPAPLVRQSSLGPARLMIGALDVTAPDGRVLFASCNFMLGAGYVLGVTGPNGSGKSSLLRSVLSDARSRCVLLDGHPISVDTRRMTWLSQASSLVLASTVESHIAEVMRLRGVYASVDDVLVDAGLQHLRNMHPADLSVGERQRLACAGCFVGDSVIWLLDEPSRALDAAGRAWLAAHIRSHAMHGGIVMLASHDRWLLDSCMTHELNLGADVPHMVPVAIASLDDGARRAYSEVLQ